MNDERCCERCGVPLRDSRDVMLTGSMHGERVDVLLYEHSTPEGCIEAMKAHIAELTRVIARAAVDRLNDPTDA